MSRRVVVGVLAAILAAVVGLVAFASLRTHEPPEARLAREALAAGRLDEARGLIERWAAAEPGGGEADYERAILEVRADRPVEALDAMRRSIARGHAEGPLQVLRAVLLARAGKLAEAEPVLTEAFQRGDEPRAEVAEGLARIYLRSFRLSEALQVLDAWARLAPDDPRPYLLRNEVDERTDAEPAARVRNYREALRRDPNRLDTRLGLAETLREGSLLDEAEVEYDALLARDPKNVRGLAGAGRVALLKGDLTAATRLFEAVLAVAPDDKAALRELGLIDMNLGRVASAKARLKRAVEVDPHDAEARYSYSRALKLAGDDTGAAEQAAATDRLKDEQKQLLDLRKALVQHPDDIDRRAQAARWLIEHGHEKEGLEWTALVLRQRPGHPATCQLLAEYHARNGEPGLANFYRMNSSEAKAP